MAETAIYFNSDDNSKICGLRLQHISEPPPVELACSAGAVFTAWPDESQGLTAAQLYLDLHRIGFANDQEAHEADRQFAKIEGWVPPSLKSVIKP